MSEKRFVYGVIKGSRQAHIKDCHTCKSATIDVYDDDFKYFVDKLNEQQATITELERKLNKYAKIGEEQLKQIIELQEENEQLRRLFEEMKQPITINLTEEDEKELRKLLGLIDDE